MDSDDANVCDIRMVEKMSLEFRWGDLEPSTFDEFLKGKEIPSSIPSM